MSFSRKLFIITSLVFCLLSVGIQTSQALTFTEVVNLLQAPDINLPTGVTNPKGNIGFILANLFWGTADGTKNGKIKPQYLDYSGISSWTQSGTITYLTASTGSVGIGTPNPGEYSTAIRGIDDTATKGALWVSGQTAGTPGLMVRNDGNVGIGTASPAWPLHVSASIADWAVGIINSNASGYGVYIKGGKADGTTQSLHIRNVDNIPLFNVLGNGNVGIGTALPRGNLDVTFPSGSNAVPFIVDNGTYGIYMAGQNTLNFNYSQNADGGGWINYYGYAGASTQFRSLFIGNGKGSPIAYFQGSTGNVGIGTTVPTSKLRIYNTNAYVGGGTPNSLGLTIDSQDNGGSTANADMYYNNLSIRNLYTGSVPTADNYKPAKIHFLTVTTDGYAAGAYIGITNVGQAYGKGDLIFGAGLQSDNTIIERMRINSAGNVGIGTASPSNYLHIKGPNIASRGQITLEGSDFTQMTFYKDATTRSMSFYQNQADGSLVLANAINNGNISNIITGAGSFFFQGGNGLIATINGSAPANSLYINSAGNVGIGTAANTGVKFYIKGNGSTSATYPFMVANSSGTNILYVNDGGGGYLGAAAWSYLSDRRLKEKITPLSYGIKEIMKLDSKKFDYIKGEKNNLGFIAQDVQSILPELVATQPSGMLGLKTDMMIPVLVNAVQELKTQKDLEISELRKQNEKLLRRIENLEKK